MERKINVRMFFIGIFSMVLTAVLTFTVFHNTYSSQLNGDIRLVAKIVGVGYGKIKNYEELKEYSGNNIRLTVVSPDGTVLYESDIDKKGMDNHSNRQEIVDARIGGEGESVRKSDTLGFNTYYYALLMSDGNVLRIAMDVKSMYTDYNKVMPMVVGVCVAIMITSMVLSQILTKKLVAPIEAMAENLDKIDEDIPYKELEPFAFAVKEHQLKKAEVAKMRQEFTANVSHELKTPLTSISGYAEMIVNGMVKEEDIKTFAGKIHGEAARLIGLIRDILNLSELDEPAVKENFEKIDLYSLAQTTLKMLELKGSKNNIGLSITGERVVVYGNRMMLEELVYNLCDNAIRYNKQGGKVEVEIKALVDSAVLSVKDNGIGISKEHQERIFERFYRVDRSRSKETGGTGLGLAIVKHIVIQHGGKIAIESQKDSGTIMLVTLARVEDG